MGVGGGGGGGGGGGNGNSNGNGNGNGDAGADHWSLVMSHPGQGKATLIVANAMTPSKILPWSAK